MWINKNLVHQAGDQTKDNYEVETIIAFRNIIKTGD